MRPQSDSSNTFNRRILFTIISLVLVLLVVVGVLVVKNVTTGNQTHVAQSPTAMPTQNGMVTVTAIPNVAGLPPLFRAPIWDCLQVTIKWCLPLPHAH